MNPWPYVGIAVGGATAPLFKKYVVETTERFLQRYLPDCWVKRVLLFKIGH